MRIARSTAAVFVVALLALLVWDVAHSKGSKLAREVDQGKSVPAPAFKLPRVNGDGKLSLVALRGKVVVVNFWASDCIPCYHEQKHLNAAAAHWRSRGVVFLGIDEVDLRGPARKYLKRFHVGYQNVADGTGDVAAKFGVTGTPETFFIDRRGRVVPPHVISEVAPADLDAGIRRALSA
jgi:cytochrome c biogenesis protein CcmG/thiol:disulfide interchange protein DsbE